MTNKLNITPEAERDIFAITANIQQQHSEQAAKRALSIFKEQLKTLAEYPDRGREGACAGTYEAVMSGLPYIAIYEKKKQTINIVRILYGAD